MGNHNFFHQEWVDEVNKTKTKTKQIGLKIENVCVSKDIMAHGTYFEQHGMLMQTN